MQAHLSGFLRHASFKIRLGSILFLRPAFDHPAISLARCHTPTAGCAFRSSPLGCSFCFADRIEISTYPHYFAPRLALLLLVVFQCTASYDALAVAPKAGRRLARAAVRDLAGNDCLTVSALLSHTQIDQPWPRGNLARASILSTLQHSPGLYLVLVRYNTTHNFDREWVYNEADIDGSKVVWARDMDDKDNQELIQYFKNRSVWLLEPDESPPKLSPYAAIVHGESMKSQLDSVRVDSATAK